VTAVYLTLGWIGVLGLEGLWESTGPEGVVLVAGGGVLYTVGAIVHAARRPDPWPHVFGYHELFHALVIAAALSHWCAIQFLVLPLGA
jgi:hemolysin III